MSLMNYGFTKKKVGSLDDNDCQVVAIKKRQEGGMVSSSEKKKKKILSKSPKKSPKKEEKDTPSKSSNSSSKKSTPKSSPKVSPKKSTSKGTIKPKCLSDSFKKASIKGSTVKKSNENSPGSSKKSADNSLPYMRIKMIMKSCPDVDIVNHESLHVITKATELFIQHLAIESLKSSNENTLDYESLSSVVHNTDTLEFLKETIPKKITWAECERIIASRKSKREEFV